MVMQLSAWTNLGGEGCSQDGMHCAECWTMARRLDLIFFECIISHMLAPPPFITLLSRWNVVWKIGNPVIVTLNALRLKKAIQVLIYFRIPELQQTSVEATT